MNDLYILIARMGWPAASARWWTMQELAGRLGDSTTVLETEIELLKLLHSCKLEAEAVEVLFISWMAAQEFGYSPSFELAESTLAPSLLSDLLLRSCGLLTQSKSMCLEEVLEDYEIPEEFFGVQGRDLPRIFLTSIEQLEAYSKLPFVRQMAFEWAKNRAAYPDAPLQRDLIHFMRTRGDGFMGPFSARPALRAISAYLRTLATANMFWNMPPRLVEQKSLLALPLHPTLAMLKPCRPEWFPNPTAFDGSAETIEASIRTILASVEKNRPGDELIAFSSPIVMSAERCIEVSLVRWAKIPGGITADADIAAHLMSFWTHGTILLSHFQEPLSTTTIIKPPTLDQLIDIDCKAWPLAGTLDFERIGYLQLDLYPSRLFLPTMPNAEKIEITPNGRQLQVKYENQYIADFCYWNVGWEPVKPVQLGGNCGTALISHGTKYRESVDSDTWGQSNFYLWQVRSLHKKGHFENYNETLNVGTLFV